MQQYKTYDTYKDSGIEWIGEIPQEWDLTRLKQHYQFEKGKNAALYTNEYIGLNEGEYPVYSGQTENNGIMGHVNTFDYDESICVFTTTVGAKVMSPKILSGKFCLSQNCLIMKKIGTVDERFLYYQLLPLFDYEKSLIPSYMQPSLRIADLKRYVIISCEEQQQIAEYLDKKCGEIDKVVEAEKSVIEKLKEYKQSIITESVTKGLDKSVPLKDSGIDWIGKIPQHWEVTSLKNLIGGIKDGTHGTFDRVDIGEYLLSAKNVYEDGLHIDKNDSLISYNDYNSIVSNGYPQKGDILICCVGTIGRCCIFKENKSIAFQRSVSFLRASNMINNKFLLYLLRSNITQVQLNQMANASAQAGIYMGALKNIKTIYIREKLEQQQIAEYLDKKCSEIDKAIADKEKVIEKFTEYKKSLIYECVTGKRKVV